MPENYLNELYYQTHCIETNPTTMARIKQFSLGTLYLLWLCEAQTAVENSEKDNLDPFAVFSELFFDDLNEEVKTVTIQALRNLADALEYRESN